MISAKEDTFHAIATQLQDLAASAGLNIASRAFAEYLDRKDSLAFLRGEFHLPSVPRAPANDKIVEETIYLCGNSLGLQPKKTKQVIQQVLDLWSSSGVLGHVESERPWVTYDEPIAVKVAKLVGALPTEVAVMGSLTSNLHFLMVSFYRPTKDRYKIIIEEQAFPSDRYAVQSQIAFHGYSPAEGLLELRPRRGEHCLREEDIAGVLAEQGASVALVLLPGVQYFTGQVFDMARITQLAHAAGCVVGWDLAHAVGNLPLALHAWDVDFAVWCSYKYLNGGPGCLAGLFVHDRHASAKRPQFLGWWSNRLASRFAMAREITLTPGAPGFRQSNPSILAMTGLLGSMLVFDLAPFAALRAKSVTLTTYLLLRLLPLTRTFDVHIITPKDPAQRGCQVSLLVRGKAVTYLNLLNQRGIVVDKREPDVLRVSPTPLYNTYTECWRFVQVFEEVLRSQA